MGRMAIWILLILMLSSLAIAPGGGGVDDTDLIVFAGQDKTATVRVSLEFNDARIVKPEPLDPEGTYKYFWDFDDQVDSDKDGVRNNDNQSIEQFAEWTYYEPGTYVVTLTVTDGSRYAMDTLIVTVDYRGPDVIRFAPERDRYLPGEVINVTWKVQRWAGDPEAMVWDGDVVLEVFDDQGTLVHTDSAGFILPSGTSVDTIVFTLVLHRTGDHRLVSTPVSDSRWPYTTNETYLTVYDEPPMDEPEEPIVGPMMEDPASPLVPSMIVVILFVLAIAWGTEASKVSLLGLGLPLYTKLRKEHILDDFTRGRILGYISANPGEHFNAIKRALDLPNGTFAHHLSVLEREGFVKSRTEGMYRRYYPMDMKVPSQGSGLKHTQTLIIEVVRETPGISQKEVAAVLGLSNSTVGYHVEDLIAKGIIRKERRGMGVRYYVTVEPVS